MATTKTKQRSQIDIDDKACRTFISKLTEAELIYVRSNIDIVQSLRDLVNENRQCRFSKQEFIEHFQIKPSQYNNFISGNWDYDLRTFAKIETAQESINGRKARKLRKETMMKNATEAA